MGQDLPRRREVPAGAHRDAPHAVPLHRRHGRPLHGQRELRSAPIPDTRCASRSVDRPHEEIEMLYVDIAQRPPGAERRRADRDRDPAGVKVDTASEAATVGHTRVGRGGARPAVRHRGRPVRVDHPIGRVRLARVGRATRDQRRRRLGALPVEVTDRPPGPTRPDATAFTRDLVEGTVQDRAQVTG